MDSLAIIKQTQDAGLKIWIEGQDIQVEGRSTPEALNALEDLRHYKAYVLCYLQTRPHQLCHCIWNLHCNLTEQCSGCQTPSLCPECGGCRRCWLEKFCKSLVGRPRG